MALKDIEGEMHRKRLVAVLIIVISLSILSSVFAEPAKILFSPVLQDALIKRLPTEDGLVYVNARNTEKKYGGVIVSNEEYAFRHPTLSWVKNPFIVEQDRPLVRNGSTADKNNTLRTIKLDYPVYYGHSGGSAVEPYSASAFNRQFFNYLIILCVMAIAVVAL